MKRALVLILLAGLLTWSCADTNSRGGITGRAASCAMCGASVEGDYFAYTADRAFGPTNR
jgi:hypothetical protein